MSKKGHEMQVDVKLDADTVNKMVTDAILGSVIGDKLREIVEKKIANLGKSYENPIEQAVDSEVKRLVTNIVNEQFKPLIESKVRELATDEMVSRIATAAWNSLINRMGRFE